RAVGLHHAGDRRRRGLRGLSAGRGRGAFGMRIRPATSADLPPIVGISKDGVADRFATADTSPVTVDRRTRWFEAHDDEYPIYVLDHEGSVGAWYSLIPSRS